MSFALDGLILATSWAHVLLSPYTKVEESFNLHAVHDVLFYGVSSASLPNYDHFVFPGAVARSFIPNVALAWIAGPLLELVRTFGFVQSKFDLQIGVRLVLATMNALVLCSLRRAVSKRFGRLTSVFFALFTCSQFHVPFWIGRPLSNMYAFAPVVYSFVLLLDRTPNSTYVSKLSVHSSVVLLAFSSVVLRAEVAVLAIPIVLVHLFRGEASLGALIRTGLIASLASIALTMAVDSYFWKQRFLWPEFYSIYFNVYEGKSAEWGVSPFHTYFSSSLPKLLLTSFPLSILGFFLDPRIRSFLFPYILFVFLMSFLGHKEWRFVVYVVPAFNIAAARGARALVRLRKGALFGRLMFLAVISCFVINLLLTGLFTMSSMANYPGGEALRAFNAFYEDKPPQPIHVHISNLAAQTGASLFLQTQAPPYSAKLLPAPQPRYILSTSSASITAPTFQSSFFSFSSFSAPYQLDWTYDKTENLTMKELSASTDITHLIVEEKPRQRTLSYGWRVVGTVEGFDRWEVGKPDWHSKKWLKKESLWDATERVFEILRGERQVLKMVKTEKLWILERDPGSATWY